MTFLTAADAVEFAKKFQTVTAAAKAAGVPRTTMLGWLQGGKTTEERQQIQMTKKLAGVASSVVPTNPEDSASSQVRYLRNLNAQLTAEIGRLADARGEMEEIKYLIEQAVTQVSPFTIPPFDYGVSSKQPCSHVVHLTDWHYGAVINPNEIEGINAFDPEIARHRVLEVLAPNLIEKTRCQRSGYNVPNLNIICTGDLISGDIHPELQVTNAFPAPQQAIACGYLLGTFIRMLAAEYENTTVDIVTLDNHGRMTKKPQAGQGGYNNWSYVVAMVAQSHLVQQSNIKINVHACPTARVVVGPESYLAFHGHQIRGWAGKPYYGFDRRVAMEAVKRMNIPEQSFTKLLLGHFHHAINGDNWILGGSLSGTDAFDHSCGRHSLPHQSSWFVHPKWGEFDFTRWWLNDN